MMILGFLVGVIVGFILSENWLKILTWLETTTHDLIDRRARLM